VEPGAPQLWAEATGNVAAEARYGDAGAVGEALARAAHVTRLRLHNQRLIAFAVEPRSATGVLESGRVTLYTQNQTPTGARDALAAALGGQSADYRVIVGDIGGGFGMKTGLPNEDALVCHAARKLGRPVRWRAERSEEFLAAHMGRDQHYDAQLALDAEGRILALRMDMLANFGAVPVGSTAIIPLALGPKVQTTVYRVPGIDFRIRGVLTNTMATGAYRGAGRPEANYLMERLIEQAGREMGIDSAEIRRRNFVREDDFPFATHLGDVYDSGAFGRMLEQLLEHAGWNGYEERREASRRRGRLRGRGLASYLEWTGAIPTETVDIQVDADGTVTVFSGTQAMGQGLETTYTQLITEVLQIPVGSVRIVQGDTDRATGVGSVGSRSAFVGGSATVAAGRRVVARGRELAAEALEAALADIEYRDGRFSIAGTDRSIALAELAAREAQGFLRVSATETPSAPSWPNGAQCCEVEIDPETGEVEVVALASVDDIGRVINHMIVEGQIHGGIAQGVGQALFEGAVYDPDSGQLLTGSLMDYCVPRADQLPAMRARFDESVPCRTNLLGVKGCGEIGTIGAVPAAVHAVLDALGGRGAAQLEMPLTPEKIWRFLQQAGG
jgi:carbon-monoxide dehydrogenase large subunit